MNCFESMDILLHSDDNNVYSGNDDNNVMKTGVNLFLASLVLDFMHLIKSL